MESLPHRKQPSPATLARKFSNINGFSAKNAYDDVFGSSPKFGAPKFLSNVEDYTEMFGSSRASSVPILDLSALENGDVSVDFRSSKIDYSKIFGGFRDEDIGVAHEELFAGPSPSPSPGSGPGGGKSSSAKAWTPTAAGSPLQVSDHLNRSEKNQVFSSEASYQSYDAVKQFNMSYHKTSQRSKDGTNGTTHVAQVDAVPGFTCFIDKIAAPDKTEVDKPKPLEISDDHRKMDFSEAILEGKSIRKTVPNLANKLTSGDVVKSRNGSSWDESCSNDKPFNANEINLKSHPSKVPPPSSLPVNLVNNKNHSQRSMASNFEAPKSDASESAAGDCSPPFFDEELDSNSAAAVSVAALRKAIEKAQESIRIAKELMERKREGLRSCLILSSKDGLKFKNRTENSIAHEGNRTKEKNAKEPFDRMDAMLQNFAGTERENALSGEVASYFQDSEKLSIDRKVIGETHAENLESEPVSTGKHRTEISAFVQTDSKHNTMQSINKRECESKEMKTTKETLEQQEGIVEKSEAVEKAYELEDMETKLNAVRMAQAFKENMDKLESACTVHEHEENEKSGMVREDEETEEKQKGFCEHENREKKLKVSREMIEDEKKFESEEFKENEAQELVKNENEQQEVPEQEPIERLQGVEQEENGNRLRNIHDAEIIERGVEEAFQWVENENKMKETCGGESNEEIQKDAHKGEDNEKRLDEVHELEVDEKRPTDAHDENESEENGNVQSEIDESEENENMRSETDVSVENENVQSETDESEENENIQGETGESEENEKIEVPQEAVFEKCFNRVSDVFSHDASNRIIETQEACQLELNDYKVETSQEATDNNGSILGLGVTRPFYEFKVDLAAAIKVAYKLKEKVMFKTAGSVQGATEDDESRNKVKDSFEALPFDDNAANFGLIDTSFAQNQVEQNGRDSKLASNLENGTEVLANESRENEKIVEEDKIAFDEEEENSNSQTAHGERQWVGNVKEPEASQVPNVSKENEKTIEIGEEIKTSKDTEENEENLFKSFAMEEKENKVTVPKEAEKQEHLRKIDEEKKKRREWAKDRMAVERAVREVRERAFAEARERAERAAVESATVEVRQRVMAKAREKREKASAGAKASAEKASREAKLRAERAAVERATAEARERALEKALSQKTTSEARAHAEKFSGASRDDTMRKSFSSSDLQRFHGTNTESSQSSKARLEKHQRIMERAAEALAEKNMRDLLAQKEQAERNRLAGVLDADIKRWASGKEGNLRALLSTLQYILVPGSGWQPISLTDMVTTDAVKKAYRKATLYVHPDKLQQRGASIQQKYICEKVFDLLKAAWNKFSSEER